MAAHGCNCWLCSPAKQKKSELKESFNKRIKTLLKSKNILQLLEKY